MPDEKVTFRGASGRAYPFRVFSLDWAFENIGAVYVFTTRTRSPDGRRFHGVIYIGETGALGNAVAEHKKALWPKQYGCDSICVHPEPDETLRLKKADDMKLFYIPFIEADEGSPGSLPAWDFSFEKGPPAAL